MPPRSRKRPPPPPAPPHADIRTFFAKRKAVDQARPAPGEQRPWCVKHASILPPSVEAEGALTAWLNESDPRAKKGVLIEGAVGAGKTTLVSRVLTGLGYDAVWLQGPDLRGRRCVTELIQAVTEAGTISECHPRGKAIVIDDADAMDGGGLTDLSRALNGLRGKGGHPTKIDRAREAARRSIPFVVVCTHPSALGECVVADCAHVIVGTPTVDQLVSWGRQALAAERTALLDTVLVDLAKTARGDVRAFAGAIQLRATAGIDAAAIDEVMRSSADALRATVDPARGFEARARAAEADATAIGGLLHENVDRFSGGDIDIAATIMDRLVDGDVVGGDDVVADAAYPVRTAVRGIMVGLRPAAAAAAVSASVFDTAGLKSNQFRTRLSVQAAARRRINDLRTRTGASHAVWDLLSHDDVRGLIRHLPAGYYTGGVVVDTKLVAKALGFLGARKKSFYR